MRHVLRAIGCGAATFLLAVSLSAGSEGPQGVSPGGMDRVAPVQSRCPTFNWQARPDAVGYEVVVYRLGEAAEADSEDELALSEDRRVAHLEVPAGVTGWTPSLDECFQADTSYVWFVRSSTAGTDGDFVPGEWSRGRFFVTPAELSPSEVARAVRVLRQYLERGGSLRALAAAGVLSDVGTGAEAVERGTGPGRVSATAPKSVTTGKTAITGTISDTVGETYGVVGINSSASGAGVGAANTSGGADLVLDGSSQGAVSALLTEATLNRPSAASQTFNVRNSVGGGMTLQVDGVEVITTLTDQNTTYSAGYGLDLAGTTFEVDVADFTAPPAVANDDGSIALTTSYQDIMSADITIPGGGYVVAHATVRCDFNNPNPPTNTLAEGMVYLCSAADTNSSTDCGTSRVAFSLRNDQSTAPVSQVIAFSNRLPYYASGGAKSVYLNAKVFGAEDTVECYYRSLVLQYVPD